MHASNRKSSHKWPVVVSPTLAVSRTAACEGLALAGVAVSAAVPSGTSAKRVPVNDAPRRTCPGEIFCVLGLTGSQVDGAIAGLSNAPEPGVDAQRRPVDCKHFPPPARTEVKDLRTIRPA